VEAGLAIRREDPRDRRQTLMSLTPAGAGAYGVAIKAVVGFNEKALKGVNRDEVQALEELLRKVVRNVIDDPAWADSILRFEGNGRS
jgi:DNA-binding MarR family transcriptional regulator